MVDDHPERLRARLLDTYRPIIDASRPVALIDFQDSMNCGDHAIWLGEKALLRDLGVEVAYECSAETYDREAMAGTLGQGQILMSGGGSFGDIYGLYHTLRLKVLAEFPDNEVVVLPQTVMFFSDQALFETAQAVAAHGKVTLSARDVLSHHVLSQAVGSHARILLAPDMACGLGRLGRRHPPQFDVVWIRRTDSEGRQPGITAFTGLALRPGELGVGAFPGGRPIGAAADLNAGRLVVSDWYRVQVPPPGKRGAYGKLSSDERARFWVDTALNLLSYGRVVISDRLHGHILSSLAGIPHVLLNNTYGKNFSYYETWSRPSSLCRLARGPKQAWETAQELLAMAPPKRLAARNSA